MQTKSTIRRKNLILGAGKLQSLARSMETSQPEAVRDAIDHALVAEKIGAAVRKLHALGGIDDVFHKLVNKEF